MSNESLFPESALALLRLTKWNQHASPSYDGMSGGFVWDDEFPQQVIDACIHVDNWAFRYVLGYRASLIRGEPREELRAAWDQLAQECPDWPGLRPERRAADLRPHLDAESARFMAEFMSLVDKPDDA